MSVVRHIARSYCSQACGSNCRLSAVSRARILSTDEGLTAALRAISLLHRGRADADDTCGVIDCPTLETLVPAGTRVFLVAPAAATINPFSGALHTALGRWLSVTAQPPAAVKVGTKPRARTRKSKRGNQPAVKGRSSSFGPLSERKGTSWFDLEPGTLAPPRNSEEEDIEAWARAHNLPGRR